MLVTTNHVRDPVFGQTAVGMPFFEVDISNIVELLSDQQAVEIRRVL